MSWFDEIFDPGAWADFLGGTGSDIASEVTDTGSSFDAGGLADWLGGAASGAFDAASQSGVPMTPEWDFFNQANAAPQGDTFGSSFMGGMSAGGAPNGAQSFNLNPSGPSSSGPSPEEGTDWRRWGRYAGMLGLPIASAGMQTLMQPSPPRMPTLPPPPSPSSQSIPPFTDQPGTRASPLISPGPTQARQTAGLQRRPAPYGGFSMY